MPVKHYRRPPRAIHPRLYGISYNRFSPDRALYPTRPPDHAQLLPIFW
jgi:hypothetical protein